ncbi:MAG: hypothetical protein EBT07_01520 [Actinobacteria bacterium]|nr:hypothetical protein [Actinomycetota bacterium]
MLFNDRRNVASSQKANAGMAKATGWNRAGTGGSWNTASHGTKAGQLPVVRGAGHVKPFVRGNK